MPVVACVINSELIISFSPPCVLIVSRENRWSGLKINRSPLATLQSSNLCAKRLFTDPKIALWHRLSIELHCAIGCCYCASESSSCRSLFVVVMSCFGWERCPLPGWFNCCVGVAIACDRKTLDRVNHLVVGIGFSTQTPPPNSINVEESYLLALRLAINKIRSGITTGMQVTELLRTERECYGSEWRLINWTKSWSGKC